MIKIIESKQTWDQFFIVKEPNTFLHSWNWGEFNKQAGGKTWRLGVYEQDKLSGIALIIKINAKRGSFLFCPHGPILNPEHISVLIEYLKELAKKEGCSFIRCSPLMTNTPENNKLWHELGFRNAPIHMHPELAWILDITKSEDELLKGMRKNTRYSIKKAEKDGVEVVVSSDPADIDKFWEIYKQTVSRQHFTPFSKDYLKSEFETFHKDNQIQLFFGKYKNETISAAMIVFQDHSAFYHHGASVHKYPQITASQLVQWYIIQQAKKRGCKLYNFWGIVPPEAKKHPWAGLSLFKRGFGGFAEEYVHAKDLIVSPKYWINYIVEKARKIKRGL